MRNSVFLCMLLVCNFFTHSLFANPETDTKIGTVRGKVIDEALQQPISFAAIVIKSKDGTKTIDGAITTENGEFEIKKLPEGEFILEVQYIGYETYSRALVITRRNRTVDIGTVSLSESSQQLSEVEVVGERTTIEQRVDRKVINVGKDLTTAGATASDIMNNIPSVNVDSQTGDLSLRGNSNVRVMVDGKLSNVPVAQLLQQIPSTSIKSIELITNPSAKYNPEGMSGIINIVLHKNANIGFNGSLSLGYTQGIFAKYNNSLDLNYRNGAFNFYGNYGNNIGNWANNGEIFRVEQNSDQIFTFRDKRQSHLFKVGVDIYLGEKNTLSFFTNQNIFDGNTLGNTELVFYDNLPANFDQANNFASENTSQQYNFNYKLDFGKEGHNIELEVDHNEFEDDQVATFLFSGPGITLINNDGNDANNLIDYTDNPVTERNQTFINLDYVNPLDSISKLELGLESRQFETIVGYTSTGFSPTPESTLIPTPSTNFEYEMDIYSAYVTFGQSRKKWSYQLGARIEDVEVIATTNAERSFTDNYTQIYPSAFVTFNLNEQDQLQASYSRRVDRPGLQQVNPIREWSTPQISSFGNQVLVPQFTNSFEINYTKRLKKGSITSGIFYRQIQDEINRAVFIDRLNFNNIILTYDNFDDTSSYGLEISANYKPTKWWSINGSFDYFYQSNNGVTEFLSVPFEEATVDDIVSEETDVENTAFNLRMNNMITLSKKLTWQVFAFYRGNNRNIQFDVDPMYFVNTGLRYSFAKGKGTLSLSFNDVFNTMRFAFDGDSPYEQSGWFNWESQNLYTGLSYRFGSGKNRAKSRKRRDKNTKQGSGGLF